MACLFNNHLIIQYDDTSDKPILIRRCCWSSSVARLSLKEFLKIKDIIDYVSKLDPPKKEVDICKDNCSEISNSIENIQILISRNCNLHCYHCFYNDHKDTKMMITLNNYCLNKLKGHSLNTLRLNGSGEIFTYYNDVIKYLRSINTKDFKNIKFFTNGNLLDDKRLEELKDISNKTGINYIFYYSVDAITEETYKKVRIGGDFNKVLHSIEKTLSLFSKENVLISFTIKKPNRGEAKLFRQFYKEKFKIDDNYLCMNYDFLNKEDDIDKKIYYELND